MKRKQLFLVMAAFVAQMTVAQNASVLGALMGAADAKRQQQSGSTAGLPSSVQKQIKKANSGDQQSQYDLGWLFEHGHGTVAVNMPQAVYWYQKAAAQGGNYAALAYSQLGGIYQFGTGGIAEDKKQAFAYYQKSADMGNNGGMLMMGSCYQFGIGTDVDFDKAADWYKKAAAAGNGTASYYLAQLERDRKDFESKNTVAMVQMRNQQGQQSQQQPQVQQQQPVARQQQQATVTKQPTVAPKQQVAAPKQPAVTPKQPAVAPKQQPAAPKQQVAVSSVDKNIPSLQANNSNTFAVIIGNERYDNEVAVPYAENDAKIFKEYCTKTLGVPEKQVKLVTNAGLNSLRMAVKWLSQAMDVCGGNGKAIFYYAGHGIPDEANKGAYLLPTDGIGSDAESAYSLDRLYAELSKMPAQGVTVFLDACFSGSKREGGMLASARGVAIKVKPSAPQGKMVVFSAATGDETAYPYQSERHGMFTYYLLKKLQSSRGNITLGELGDYLTTEVKRQSFVENGKMQTPTVTPATTLSQNWRSMKLK